MGEILSNKKRQKKDKNSFPGSMVCIKFLFLHINKCFTFGVHIQI